jgi:hypothetical protein
VQVAVVAVKVVEGAVDEVVDVVAVGNGGVPAARVMLRRALHGRARGGAPPVHLEDVVGDSGAAG